MYGALQSGEERMSNQTQTFSPTQQQFKELERIAFAEGALSAKTKEIIAFAAACMTRSQSCIDGHIRRAKTLGATQQELREAMWIAAVMQAAGSLGGAGERAEMMIASGRF
jgi:AhpD family alkylhydroperoxidase